MPDLSGRIILRWDSAASCAGLLEAGGIDAVWLRVPGGEAAARCRAAGAETIAAGGIRICSPNEYGRQKTGAGTADETLAVNPGAWPGAESARRRGDGVVAGATTQPWVTANGYLVHYLRALFPGSRPILAYEPEPGRTLPSGSLELALVDAWVAGGNAIVSPDPAYCDALLSGDRAALASWARMGRTARWLRERRQLFLQPVTHTITVLVDSGDASAEIANLMYRQGASPDLASTTRAPAPDPGRKVIAAAGIASPSAALRRLLLAHVRAGAAVLTDDYSKDAWWRTPALKLERGFEDREFYALGGGRVVAYKQPVADPGDFALDAIDLAGDQRPVRLWNCPAAIAAASNQTLSVVNYGSPARGQVLARWHGACRAANLLRPEGPDVALRPYRRGGRTTEVVLPGVSRVAVVVFD